MEIGTLPIGRLDEFSMLLTGNSANLITSASDGVLLAASENGEPAGILAALCAPEDLHIAWLSVAERYRFRGIGGGLVRALALGAGLLTGQVTCSFISKEPYAFFERMGFKIEPNKNGAGKFTTTMGRLGSSPFWAGEVPSDQYIFPFRDLEPRMITRYLSRYRMTSNTYLPPFDSQLADPEISHALVFGGEIQGIMACARCGEGLEVLWVHFQQKYSSHMPVLMRVSYRLARRLLSPDAPVTMHVLNEAARRMAEKLAGDAEFIQQYDAVARLGDLRVSAQARLFRDELPTDIPDWFTAGMNDIHR